MAGQVVRILLRNNDDDAGETTSLQFSLCWPEFHYQFDDTIGTVGNFLEVDYNHKLRKLENDFSIENCKLYYDLLESELNLISGGGPSTNLIQMNRRGFVTSKLGSVIRITGECKSQF